jgi:hypothetical protein
MPSSLPIDLWAPRFSMALRMVKRSLLTSVLFLDNSTRFFDPNGIATLASTLIVKEKKWWTWWSAAQQDTMRVERTEKSSRKKKNFG